jgi:hypothetical protein
MRVSHVEFAKLRDMRPGESSAGVRGRVEAARQHQRNRFAGTDIASNADMRPAQIRKYCVLDEACQNLMKTAMRQLQLTARAYHRVLKLSRTIAAFCQAQSLFPRSSFKMASSKDKSATRFIADIFLFNLSKLFGIHAPIFPSPALIGLLADLQLLTGFSNRLI